MAEFQYSVVVPVFNSEETVEELLDRTFTVFEKLGQSCQMVFVDDNSQDNSWKVLCGLRDKHQGKVKAIRLNKNFGQQAATLCGLHHADGSQSITIDDDLQIPPEEIPKLIDAYDYWEPDIVYGRFPKKKHDFIRNFGSWAVNGFLKLFGTSSGNSSSFRLLNTSIAKSLQPVQQRFFSLDEILSWQTSRTSVVEVEHEARTSGESGYSFFKLVFMSLNYIINYTVVPLRIMTYTGLISGLVFLVIGGKYVYDKLYKEVELGFTSIIVAIFFSASLILFCLGIIGEYISRIYYKQGMSQVYVIRDKQE